LAPRAPGLNDVARLGSSPRSDIRYKVVLMGQEMDAASSLPKMRQYLRKMKRHSRHVPKLINYGTPRKLANIMLAEWELRRQETLLRCLPYYYIVDVCNVCNLRCPLCPTGNTTIARKQAMFSFEQYKEVFDKIREYALVVSLYNHGEPLLNPEVFSIIEHTHRNRVGTNISSNFNWPQPVDINDFIRSGLDYVTVSLDGVSQEAYQQYRVRGDLAEGFDNLRRLVSAKRALNSKTPFVEWQFIVFKHNEHEMNKARQLASEIGVDLLRFVSPGMQPEDMHKLDLQEKWMPDNPLYWERNPKLVEERGYVFDRACFYLYRSMFIYPGGGVTPCCFAHDDNQDFGNIYENSVSEIWNNKMYRSARMLFSKRAPSESRVETICDKCTVFRQDGAHLCGVRSAHDVFREERKRAANRIAV
jgi:radical SAM protein with 4Fe4S-binding SPASM domain